MAKKLYNFNAKEILQIINDIPAPTKVDINNAKVAAISCRSAKEFAEFLGLEVLAFKAWCNTYPDYQKAVTSWRDHATNEVEVALAKKAIGFTKKIKKDILNSKTGTIETLEIETYYPPDPTAAQFWLKNRAPEDWKDKSEVDVNVNANIRAWLIAAGEEVQEPVAIEGDYQFVGIETEVNEPLNITSNINEPLNVNVAEPLNVTPIVLEQEPEAKASNNVTGYSLFND